MNVSWIWRATVLPAMVLGMSAFGIWTFRRPAPAPDVRHDSLVAILRAEKFRPTEGRLSGLPFLAAPSITRGRTSVSAVQLVAFEALRDSRDGHDTSYRAVALAHASLREWDDAVDALEDAVVRKVGAASVLNDLSALYLARATNEGRTEDAPRALAFAERAIAADASPLEPYFNRAMSLEALYLRDAAEQAWKDYIARETDASWLAEARARLSKLSVDQLRPWKTRQPELILALASPETRATAEAELRRDYARSTRETIEFELLPAWSEDVIANRRTEAIAKLSTARTLAGALASAGGDPMWIEAIQRIDRAAASKDARRLTRLARAHAAFTRGTRTYLAGRVDKAVVEDFPQAERALREEGSPLVLWIQAYHALYRRFEGKPLEGLALLERGELAARRRRYGLLDGRVEWFKGLISAELGRPDDALAAYRRAHETFLAIGERGRAADAEGLIADQLSYLGRFPEAWTLQMSGADRHWRALGQHSRVAMWAGTFLAVANGLPEVALYFQNAVVGLVSPTEQVAYPEAYLFRARVRARLGMAQGTREDLDEAQRGYDRMAASDMKDRVRAELQWIRAEAASVLGSHASSEAADEALQFFRRGDFPYDTVRVLRTSARLHLSASRIDKAEADLTAAIEEFERQRAKIRDTRLRVTPFEEGALAFEDMIRLQTQQRGRWDLAFRYAERSRGFTLRGAGGADPAQGGPPNHASLPAGVVMLYYVTLDDRLLIFGMTSREFRWSERQVGRGDLAARLRRLRALASSGDVERLRPLLREWYDDLAGPVADLIADGSTVAFVPDGLLNDVPFAALVQRSGRFLVEDHTVVRASSLASFVHATNTWARRAGPLRSALVAAPAATVDGTRRLPSLSTARQEAVAIAERYPDATVLVGSDATRQTFEKKIADADVIHFAGHAVANLRFPLLSRLLFTASEDGQGALSAFELEGLSLRRTRVVTLAACETAGGLFVRGEGTLSLARPWLRAGAAAVVATIWELGDESAGQLFTSLHALIADGMDPADALRRVQVEAIRGGRTPFRDWAGLAMFGAAPLGRHAE